MNKKRQRDTQDHKILLVCAEQREPRKNLASF